MIVPPGFGNPAMGIPACDACGCEFWMDADGYVEWYAGTAPHFPATLFAPSGRIIGWMRNDHDGTFVPVDIR